MVTTGPAVCLPWISELSEYV
eukprot:g664.t1